MCCHCVVRIPLTFSIPNIVLLVCIWFGCIFYWIDFEIECSYGSRFVLLQHSAYPSSPSSLLLLLLFFALSARNMSKNKYSNSISLRTQRFLMTVGVSNSLAIVLNLFFNAWMFFLRLTFTFYRKTIFSRLLSLRSFIFCCFSKVKGIANKAQFQRNYHRFCKWVSVCMPFAGVTVKKYKHNDDKKKRIKSLYAHFFACYFIIYMFLSARCLCVHHDLKCNWFDTNISSDTLMCAKTENFSLWYESHTQKRKKEFHEPVDYDNNAVKMLQSVYFWEHRRTEERGKKERRWFICLDNPKGNAWEIISQITRTNDVQQTTGKCAA